MHAVRRMYRQSFKKEIMKQEKKFVKSCWVFIYKRRKDNFAIFNSKNLETFFIDQEVVNLIEYFKKPRTMNEVFSFFNEEFKDIVDKLINAGFIVFSDLDESKNLCKEVVLEEKKKRKTFGSDSKLNSLRVILTERCNLNCNYCFVRDREMKKDDDISFATIKRGVDLLASLNQKEDIEIQFFGGEPLLKWDLILKTVDYIDKLINKGEINNVYYGITTNGILINRGKSRFLKKYNFLISVSLDGWEEFHNQNRCYINGRGSFKDTLNGLRIIQKDKNEIGILITPDKNNIKQLADACEYIIDKLGFNFITINTPQPIKGDWEIDGTVFSQQIKKCFKVAKKHQAIINSFGTRVLYALNDKKSLIFSCSRFGDNFTATLTPQGKLSPCIVSWHHRDFLDSLDKFSYQGTFSDWKFKSPYYFKKCLNCPAMNVCGGPCPLEVYEFDKFSKKIDHQRCNFFKDFLEWAIWFKG